ncbi:MAG: hypothetical protein V1729_01890 [Candidatus Woesearchaeota archaeon]
MVWYMSIGMYFWDLFTTWLSTLFVAPFRHTDMLWLLIPIWISWFFAEFFQEKHGTSMGNAITNSVVVIWGSIDCARQTVRLITTGMLTSTGSIIIRFLIITIILTYGVAIIVLGLKGNKVIKYIGRVREVTYAFAIFTPVFYNAVPLTLKHVIGALLFFPLFYFAIELIDRYTPNPKAVVEDMEEGGASKSSSGGSGDWGGSSSGSSSSKDPFGSSSSKKGGDDLGDFKF